MQSSHKIQKNYKPSSNYSAFTRATMKACLSLLAWGICWKEPLRAPGLYIQAPARSLANSTQHSITKPVFLLAQYTVPCFCSSNEHIAGSKKPAKSRSLFYLVPHFLYPFISSESLISLIQWINYFTIFPLSLISNPSTLQVPNPRYVFDLDFPMSYFAIVT